MIRYKNPSYNPKEGCFRIGGAPCCMAVCDNGYRCQKKAVFAHKVKARTQVEISCSSISAGISPRNLIDFSIPPDEIYLCDRHTEYFTNGKFFTEASSHKVVRYGIKGTVYAACMMGVGAATVLLGPVGGMISGMSMPVVEKFAEGMAGGVSGAVVDYTVDKADGKVGVPTGARMIPKDKVEWAGYGGGGSRHRRGSKKVSRRERGSSSRHHASGVSKNRKGRSACKPTFRCMAISKSRRRCKNRGVYNGYCRMHAGQGKVSPVGPRRRILKSKSREIGLSKGQYLAQFPCNQWKKRARVFEVALRSGRPLIADEYDIEHGCTDSDDINDLWGSN